MSQLKTCNKTLSKVISSGLPDEGSFHLRDNSVHLYDCSPFWIGILIIVCKENYYVYCLMLTCAVWLTKHWTSFICYKKVEYYVTRDIYYCHLQLRKTQFQTFNYIHIIEIPTNKEPNYYLSKIEYFSCSLIFTMVCSELIKTSTLPSVWPLKQLHLSSHSLYIHQSPIPD